jgi:hypothetical protein
MDAPYLTRRLTAISRLIRDFEAFIKGGPAGDTFVDTLNALQAARADLVKQLRGIA